MPNVFVNKKDRVKVQVYVYETLPGQLDATSVKDEVPNASSADELEFLFRRSNYADSQVILGSANLGSDNTSDLTKFSDTVLRRLLVGWNISDEDGNPVPFSRAAINDLHPAVARAAIAGALEQISI